MFVFSFLGIYIYIYIQMLKHLLFMLLVLHWTFCISDHNNNNIKPSAAQSSQCDYGIHVHCIQNTDSGYIISTIINFCIAMRKQSTSKNHKLWWPSSSWIDCSLALPQEDTAHKKNNYYLLIMNLTCFINHTVMWHDNY